MAEFATTPERGDADGAPRASQPTAGRAPTAWTSPSLAAPAPSDSGASKRVLASTPRDSRVPRARG